MFATRQIIIVTCDVCGYALELEGSTWGLNERLADQGWTTPTNAVRHACPRCSTPATITLAQEIATVEQGYQGALDEASRRHNAAVESARDTYLKAMHPLYERRALLGGVSS